MNYRVSFFLLSLGIHVLNLSHPLIELHYSVHFSKFRGVRVERLRLVLMTHNRDIKIQRRDGIENVALNVNLRSCSLYSDYSYPLT